MVTFRLNLWIIWMTISLFGISLVGWKQEFMTTKLRGGQVLVTRIPMKWVRVIIWLSTLIFVGLLLGETVITFRAEEIELTASVVALIVLATIFYHVFMRVSFNQARKEHDAEMKEVLVEEMEL